MTSTTRVPEIPRSRTIRAADSRMSMWVCSFCSSLDVRMMGIIFHHHMGARHLEQLQGMIKGGVEPPPVAKLIGFDMVSIDRGLSVFEMDAGPQHANPMGTLHGGILCDLADAACGTAMAS